MNLEKAEVDRIFKELQWSSKSYRKNEVIFRGDEYIEDLGIILEGKVIICKETGAGNKTMIALLDKGNFIGEVMAVSRNRITNTVIAGENGTEILFIPIPEILRYKSLTDNLIMILAKKAFYLNRRVYYLQLKSIRSKISLFLLEEAEKNKSLAIKAQADTELAIARAEETKAKAIDLMTRLDMDERQAVLEAISQLGMQPQQATVQPTQNEEMQYVN